MMLESFPFNVERHIYYPLVTETQKSRFWLDLSCIIMTNYKSFSFVDCSK